jgi:alpha-tubulin suppressor-like RCC1 family protein
MGSAACAESGDVVVAGATNARPSRRPFLASRLGVAALLACILSLTATVAAHAFSPQLSAGIAHTCALLPSGHVDCWGEGFYGQLGDGVFQSSAAAVAVEGIATATSLSAGGLSSCAVLASGHVKCWGWNEAGQLGNGDKTNASAPVEVQTISTATQVSVGERHACALLETGHVDCWGDGEQGQLGDGSLASSTVPVEVQGIANATQISAGGVHTCAVLATSHIECWGRNGAGELGDGSNSPTQDTPVEVQGIGNATSVSGGWEHTCALLSTSHVDCWGANFYGQIGNGGPGHGTSYETPVEVKSLSGAIRLSSGSYHTCAVLTGGAIDCWGDNQWGQLGNGTLANANVPSPVKAISNATAVAGGEEYTCAALSSGHIECWGRNYWDQLGNGTEANSSVPVEVAGLANASAVVAGSDHTCAILSSSHVQCWGDNTYGQLGDATTTDAETPVEVEAITNAARLAAGEYHTCAVLLTGHVDCWGSNGAGQLGDGTSSGPEQCERSNAIFLPCATTPVEVQAITTAIAAAAGGDHTCALLASGHVDCWGANNVGQLGNGTTTSASAPVEATGLATGAGVAAGEEFSCAVLTSGHVDCWGQNNAAQLGNGTTTNSSTPREVTGIGTATQVAAGDEYACALLSSGRVECWGSGELGDGTHTYATTPVEVQGITNATAIAAASDFACALLSTAHIDCWGLNNWGQLGNASSSESNVPVAVQGMSDAAGVTAGGLGNISGHTCAVLTSGRIECWGYNYYGELGDGTAWSTLPGQALGVSWAATPTAITGAASSIGQTSATLNATVDPEGETVTSCLFEYGTSSSYEASVPCSAFPEPGAAPVAVSANLTALSANTTYHYRIEAATEGGTSYGSDGTFATPPNVPTVYTGPASSVSQTAATLEASVNPEGAQASDCRFEYGTSAAYGASVPCGQSPGEGSKPVAVSATLTGLTANTEYHYRIVATNAGGTAFGDDTTFETAGPEFGRCLKLGAPTGSFANSVCTNPAGTMKYEWYLAGGPVKPLEHAGFTSAIKPTTTMRIETTGKRTILCTGETGSGAYVADKTVASVQLRLSGCHHGSSEPCSTGATAGELVTSPLSGTLGVILTSTEGTLKNEVGLDLRPAPSTPIAEFSCGHTAYLLTGAVIAEVKTNAMQLNTDVWKLAETKGIQKPVRFEGREEQTLQLRVGGGGGPEQAGVSLSVVISNEEKVETSSVL